MKKWILSYDHHMMHPLVDDIEERLAEDVEAYGLGDYRDRGSVWGQVSWRNLEDIARPVVQGIKETMVWASE